MFKIVVKRTIFLFFFIFCTSIVIAQRKDWPDTLPQPDLKQISPLDPWPGIEKYPDVFQEYDVQLRKYLQWYKQTVADTKTREALDEKVMPAPMLYAIAPLNLRIHLYYDQPNNNSFQNWYRYGQLGNGFLYRQLYARLHGKWHILLRNDGLILGKVVKDTSIAYDETEPQNPHLTKVLFIQVIEDVWNSVPEDTVMIRYYTDWFRKIPDLRKRNILVLIKDGSPAVLSGKIREIYHAENVIEEIPQYLVVDKGIIRDPNNIFAIQREKSPFVPEIDWQSETTKIIGMQFQTYKKEWENFMERNEIKK